MALGLDNLDKRALKGLSDAQFESLLRRIYSTMAEDRKEEQIRWYVPAQEGAYKIHESTAKIIGAGGGNRSSKTESMLVECVALSTGIFPEDERLMPQFRRKFTGAINVRVVVESLTNTLYPIILPKLQWWHWEGVDQPGGARGHWGWIPKRCLIDGEWERSYNKGLRTLRMLCYDPDDPERVLGESTWQFMSYDQDPSDFASGSFHIVLHDEPPRHAIWKENVPRVMDVGGRLLLSMTWPDDPSIPVDWLFDEIYEPGRPGPAKDPNIDWIELYSLDNVHLERANTLETMAQMTEEEKKVRIYGQPIRFSNRVHPLFTDITQDWCFKCGKTTLPRDGLCPSCGSDDVVAFTHVDDFEVADNWPCVFVIDPHPRKPHMFSWIQVSPSDDYLCIREAQIEGDATDVWLHVDEMEQDLGLYVTLRLMDPNMGRQPVHGNREVNWQDEFEAAGLFCELADDHEIGRRRLDTWLRPDPATRLPRFQIHASCELAVYQMKRYMWDDFRIGADRDIKQKPKDKNDDYPTMFKYLMNRLPSFGELRLDRRVFRRAGTRRGAY